MSDLGNKQIMAANIRYYMTVNNVDRNQLCEAIGTKYTTLCDWLHAKTYPRIDKIEKMANFFQVEKADLVERRSEGEADVKGLSIEEREVVNRYRNLSESKRKAFLALLKDD